MGLARGTQLRTTNWNMPVFSPDWGQVQGLLGKQEEAYNVGKNVMDAPINASEYANDPEIAKYIGLQRQGAMNSITDSYMKDINSGNKSLQGYLQDVHKDQSPGGVEYQLNTNKVNLAQGLDDINKSNYPGNYKQLKKAEFLSRYKGTVIGDNLAGVPDTNLTEYVDGMKLAMDYAKEMAATTTDINAPIEGLSEIVPNLKIYTDGHYYYSDQLKTVKLEPDQLFNVLKPILKNDPKYMAWNQEQTNLDFLGHIDDNNWKEVVKSTSDNHIQKIDVLTQQIEKTTDPNIKKVLENSKIQYTNDLLKIASVRSLQDLKNKYSDDLIENTVSPIANLKSRNDIEEKLTHWVDEFKLEAFKASQKEGKEPPLNVRDFVILGYKSYYELNPEELKDIDSASDFISKQQLTAQQITDLKTQIQNTQEQILKAPGIDPDIAYKMQQMISEVSKDGNITRLNNTSYGTLLADIIDFKKLRDTKTYGAMSDNDKSKLDNMAVAMEQKYGDLKRTLDDHDQAMYQMNSLWTQLTQTDYNNEKPRVASFDQYKKDNNITTKKSEQELATASNGLKFYSKDPEILAYQNYKDYATLHKNDNPIVKKFNDGIEQIKHNQLTEGSVYLIDAAATKNGKSADDIAKYKDQLSKSIQERLSVGTVGDIIFPASGEVAGADDLSKLQTAISNGKRKDDKDGLTYDYNSTVTFQQVGGRLYAALTVSGVDLGKKNKSKDNLKSNDELNTIGIEVNDKTPDLESLASNVLGISTYSKIRENKNLADLMEKNSGYARYSYQGLEDKFGKSGNEIIIKRDFANKDQDGKSKGNYLIQIPESSGEYNTGATTQENRISFHTNNIGLVVELNSDMEYLMKNPDVISSLKMKMGDGTKDYLIGQIQNLTQNGNITPVIASRIYDKYLKETVDKTPTAIPYGNFINPLQGAQTQSVFQITK